ncbi:hypothetical protein SHELI_v1c04670 [Spiroplasma helicoides]|uniref:Uncharacterized protein n=1 Tax=Spiroplasma helicoides TaxID=216938 RepID=A0A1B3SKF9_9MOLU|nr:hypothetical protein [Spiroplasma helicoides]AOG60418.1 hypothetical protein SHELI_v1c04670 [Spiroplasma helicoides]
MNTNIDKYWNKFIKEQNIEQNIGYKEHFYFGNNKKLANNLANLVMIGVKKATSS